MKPPAGTWQRYAPPPTAADCEKILRKHNRRIEEAGQAYLDRKSGKPTLHQEILNVLMDQKEHDMKTNFNDTFRFGPLHQVPTKIKYIARRGDATGEWVVQRNGNLVRLTMLP